MNLFDLFNIKLKDVQENTENTSNDREKIMGEHMLQLFSRVFSQKKAEEQQDKEENNQ